MKLTSIVMLSDYGDHKAGDRVPLLPDVAREFVRSGIAEAPKPAPVEPLPEHVDEPETKDIPAPPEDKAIRSSRTKRKRK